MRAIRRGALGAILLGAAVAAPAAAHDGGLNTGHATIAPQVLNPFAPGAATAQNAEYVTGDNTSTGGHVVVEGKRLYVGNYGTGLRIYDISKPAEPKRIGQFWPGVRADVPPDATVFKDGRQIAVSNGTRRGHRNSATEVGRTDLNEWIDVSDPANPLLIHRSPADQKDGESHNGDIVDKRRLYLPSGGSGDEGLRIYSLKDMSRTPSEECEPEKRMDNPCAPDILFRGDPQKMWEESPYFDPATDKAGPAFTHTHDITVYTDRKVQGLGKRDIALLAEGGSYANNSGNTGSVFVIDITNPRDPQVLQRWKLDGDERYRGKPYHPIRYHHEAQFIDGQPDVMLVADEDLHNGCGRAGGAVAVRLSANLQETEELSEWFIPQGTPAPVCSVHVFSSRGSTVYIGSYNAGLQVVDYSDPENPKRVGQYIAPGSTAWGAQVHEDVVYVGDMSRGLDVLRFTGAEAGGGPGKGKGPKNKG